MTTSPPLFAAITGTTASGKTRLSMGIAQRLPVEIVSMDSRQVYAGMDVGTDKAPAALRARVPHHGLDLVSPDQRYSAGQFARDARRWITEIRERGRLPLLVGGTGFFLKAVLEPMFEEPPVDRERQGALRRWLSTRSRAELESMVTVLDEERAPLAMEGGPQRMARTIEIALLTGRSLSEWHRVALPGGEGVPGVVLLLDLPRETTVRRIDLRVASMVENGLVEEVRALVDAGYGDDAPGMTGVGYREITGLLRDEKTLDEAVEEIRINTRRYARRQTTWFRHQLPEETVRIDASQPPDQQVAQALDAMRAAGLDLPSAPFDHDGGALPSEAGPT